MARSSDPKKSFFSSSSSRVKVPSGKLNIKKIPTYAAHKENRVREKLGANQSPTEVKAQVQRQQEFIDEIQNARKELGRPTGEEYVDLTDLNK